MVISCACGRLLKEWKLLPIWHVLRTECWHMSKLSGCVYVTKPKQVSSISPRKKIVMGSMLKPRQIEHKPILTRGDPSLRKYYKSDPTLW